MGTKGKSQQVSVSPSVSPITRGTCMRGKPFSASISSRFFFSVFTFSGLFAAANKGPALPSTVEAQLELCPSCQAHRQQLSVLQCRHQLHTAQHASRLHPRGVHLAHIAACHGVEFSGSPCYVRRNHPHPVVWSLDTWLVAPVKQRPLALAMFDHDVCL